MNKLFGLFCKYTSLSILGMLGVSCYILADTFFVSLGLGKDGLAALNLAIPVYNVMHGSGLMLGMGSATRFAILKSRNEESRAGSVFTAALILAGIFSVIFVLAGIFLAAPLSAALGAEGNIFSLTKIYIRVLLLFSPAFMLNNVLLCFVRNDKNPQLAMAAMLTGSFSNILLDYLFIFPCGMGMFGAILATGLSPVISVAIISVHFLSKKCSLRPAAPRPFSKNARTSLVLGVPTFVEQLSSGVIVLVFNSLILRIAGSTGVAAYGVVANISLVVIAVFTGLAQGVQPLVSRARGLSRPQDTKTYFTFSAVAVTCIALLFYAVLYFFAAPITDIFNSEKDATLADIAIFGLKVYFIGAPFAGINIVFTSFFTSSENPLPAHIVTLLRGIFVIVPTALLFSALWELTGIWLSFPVTEAAVFLVALLLFYRYKKRIFGTQNKFSGDTAEMFAKTNSREQ